MGNEGQQNHLHQSAEVPPQSAGTPPGADGPWVPQGVIVGVAILLAVAMVAGGAVGINWYRGRDTGTAAPQTSQDREINDSSPTEPDDFESIGCPEGTDEVICDAVAFVENTRERPFKTFPEVELLDEDAFTEALLEGFDEGRVDLENAELGFKGLGLIEPDVDLFEDFREILSIGVVGFYDPETGRLVVRSGDLNLYAQSILVHELVHAFDDQWFDLDREFDDDEAGYGFLAVVEGNATRVDQAWEAQLSSDDRAQFEADRAALLAGADFARLLSFPQAVLELQASPYTDGPVFLDAVSADESEIDALLTDPPETSERILHPEISAEDDPQIAVDPPERDDVVDDGKLGELVLRLVFGERAAAGWEGDSYVVWSEQGQACIAANVIVETEQDLDELQDAVDDWAAEIAGRTWERFPDTDVFALGFTNCG